MKKRIYLVLLTATVLALPACNTETGTSHETKEGYGAGQEDPGDVGEGGPTTEMETGTTSGTTTSDTSTGEPDTSGTAATMETKKDVGTTQTKGTTNTSKSETTKNVEVKKP